MYPKSVEPPPIPSNAANLTPWTKSNVLAVTREPGKRDSNLGRIWRVRHTSQPAYQPVNIEQAQTADLVKHLASDNLWEMRAAWHQIEKRQAKSLIPALTAFMG